MRRESRARHRAHLNLLRGFELIHDGERLVLPAATQRLVAFLALQGRELARDYVAGTLWFGCGQDAANASLRTALWRLKRLCGSIFEARATSISLSRDVIVDVRELTALAIRVSGGDSTCADHDLRALTTAGDLLPDWYDEWVIVDRERFRQTRLHALDSLCCSLAQQGRYGPAVEAGLAAVAAEPSRESAHRAVIQAHLKEGNPLEALRQYELCRRLLRGLGCQPSDELEQLRRRCGGHVGPLTAAA